MIKRFLSFILLVVLIVSLPLFMPPVRQLLLDLGFVQEEINIAGTGSMYPTFPKSDASDDLIKAVQIVAWPKMRHYPAGINILGYKLFPYNITHGDIVEFENEKTKNLSLEKYKSEAGFVKRVIGLPGDRLELRDGYVKLNESILDEPYIAKPRSTFGGDFLPDCQALKVPDGKLLVMGDNRKASLDSRFELGLVNDFDIHYVLPWSQQQDYRSKWRSTQDDISYAHTVTLSPVDFVKLLNEKRKQNNLKSLKYDARLTTSGKIRSSAMIKYNDFSQEASRSAITLSKAVAAAGYRNIIFAEVYTRGFYDVDELLDNFLEFPDTKKILYSVQYQDIGIGVELGEINNCPVQVIVAHLGGYVPPNYTKSEIDSWQKLVDNLEEVMPSWRGLKQVEGIDQSRVAELLQYLETRLINAQKIVSRMRANLWLSDEERQMMENDKKLNDDAVKLMTELNKK